MTITHDEPLVRVWRFTVDDYHRMAEAGILGEDDRVELIEGQVVPMSPIGGPHVGCVNRLNRLLVTRAGPRAVVSVQNPVRLDRHSEPQPDLAVLRPKADDYASGVPLAADVIVLIEVCDSSVRYDREVKVPLYAKAGVAEVWLVDLGARELRVHRRPSASGYSDVTTRRSGEVVSPLALADVTLTVDEVLG
jgi:Uma2 family endonuclease